MLYKLITVSFTLSFFILLLNSSFSYDIQSRSNLLDDKFEIQKNWVPERSHDYFLDINFRNSASMKAFLESLKSNIKDEASAQSFLVNNDKTEKHLGLKFDLNIPLPSFSLLNTKIKTAAFLESKINYFQGIMSSDLDCGTIALLIPAGLPVEIKNLFTCSYYNSLSPGDDLISNMVGLSASLKSTYSGKFYKSSVESIPYFHLYTEAKLKLGFKLFFPIMEKFFLNFNFYGSPEAITKAMMSYSSLKGGISDSSLFKPSIEFFIKGDLAIMYENKNWQVGAELRDFIIKNIITQDASDASKMKKAPLVQIYGRKRFTIGNVRAEYFLGFHWRSLYKIYEGLYIGNSFSLPFRGKKNNLILKNIFDPEYYSAAIVFESSFIDFGLKAQYPIRVKSNDIKLSPLYNFNLNLHF